ncbi:response regulator [Flavobacterium okayamense]|uniref:DNA-binding response regulator n=1 Tax=Flavobacterium okayamense TaxID=2830782 RepID=A0ABM7S9J1_9FLAO|nr:response regulator [Flavobacterium okayamense]BCY27579.1 DNA-binding response regulator [Flavobacterium okayamense]
MSTKLRILIVDDHPFIIDAYINLISCSLENYELEFLRSSNTKEAYNLIKVNYNENNKIDFAIFDISMPEYIEMSIYDGLDLALDFKKKFTDAKIFMISMHAEGCIVNKLFKELKPDAIINKSDIDFESFSEIFSKVFNGEFFISETMLDALNQFNQTKFRFDDLDAEIIRLLERGIKTKDLPGFTGISLSAIEKRKKEIKFHLLEGENGNDKDLIDKARLLKLV